jgi:hypothetical protein
MVLVRRRKAFNAADAGRGPCRRIGQLVPVEDEDLGQVISVEARTRIWRREPHLEECGQIRTANFAKHVAFRKALGRIQPYILRSVEPTWQTISAKRASRTQNASRLTFNSVRGCVAQTWEPKPGIASTAGLRAIFVCYEQTSEINAPKQGHDSCA